MTEKLASKKEAETKTLNMKDIESIEVKALALKRLGAPSLLFDIGINSKEDGLLVTVNVSCIIEISIGS